jgi:hypothetical protein
MNFTRTPARRRTLAGITAAVSVAGLFAVMAPVASGAGGDNVGPAATGPAASPATAKKDRWAVIDANGAIARGKGVVSVTHTAGAGSYIVFFDKNVRQCLYNATIGLSGASGTSARGFITTVGAAAGVEGVFVTTDDTAGNPSERGFHLYVGCA